MRKALPCCVVLVCAVACGGGKKATDGGTQDMVDLSTGDPIATVVDDLTSPDDLNAEPDLTTLAAYDPCPPAGTACKVMPLGDSITYGYQSSTGGGYRIELFTRALSDKKDITFVGSSTSGPAKVDNVTFPTMNEGHSGYTIKDGAGRTGIYDLTAASLTKYTPHIVLLMIGTNDVDTNNDLDNAPSRLSQLVDLIYQTSPNVLLVVAEITPTQSATENMLVTSYNTGVANVVAMNKAMGKHIVLVNMYAAFTADANYSKDYMTSNLHPNDKGYSLMGDTWYAVVGPLLK